MSRSTIILSTVQLLLLWLLQSCHQGSHFIADSSIRKEVSARFEVQKELAHHRDGVLFGVFDQELTLEEREAMEYLYAYMSLNDLADYTGDFFLKNVRSSLMARETFSWGETVPAELFRHFVLPVRVNNENLDSSRWVIFSELKERIGGMTMKEAALEVNHWCHEKVIYKGTDSRTSSPLATIRTAFGRCGEESTLTTAAMRAVGIPARQCYTPRWAHGDDNHAWVEVWIDGKWHYLGACELEPDLDIAWFTAPAKRAMLVTTNVFGDYRGPEDVLVKDERFTRINILSNYTETRRLWARVLTVDQQPVVGADIEFQLYNYAEFYPLLKTTTDGNGMASLLTGYGDLLVWASSGNRFGFAKADVRRTDTVFVYLELTTAITGSMDLDMVPPARQDVTDSVSDSLRALNTRRLAMEDRLRTAYEATFIDSVKSNRLAVLLEVDPGDLWDILHRSRGNWREVLAFISDTPDSLKQWVFPLLRTISEKDLRDINKEVLADAIRCYLPTDPVSDSGFLKDFRVQYIMSPRIDNEWLKPFHSLFRQQIPSHIQESATVDPATLGAWVRQWVTIEPDANYSRAPLTPVGVYELQRADMHSRDLFFVALCRSIGIPSRLEPATRVLQYYLNGSWHDHYLETPPAESGRSANLILYNDPSNPVKPQYSIHFSIGEYQSGFYKTLDYENSPIVQSFPASLHLIPDSYLIVMGNRQPDGTVLSRMVFLDLQKGKTVKMPLSLRKDLKPPPVFGSFVMPVLRRDLESAGVNPDGSNGIILSWLDPDKEPSRHFVADLVNHAGEFGEWDGTIVLFLPDQASIIAFQAKEGSVLPGNIRYATIDAYPFDKLYFALDIPLTGKNPVVIYANPGGVINYFTEGYRIGIGDELLKIINRFGKKQGAI